MIGRLKQQIKQLELEKAMAPDVSKPPSRIKSNNVPPGLVAYTADIDLLARKVITVVEPWIDAAIFREPCPDGPELMAAQRYATPESALQGLLAEVYVYIPPRLLEVIDSDFFGDKVSALPHQLLITTEIFIVSSNIHLGPNDQISCIVYAKMRESYSATLCSTMASILPSSTVLLID